MYPYFIYLDKDRKKIWVSLFTFYHPKTVPHITIYTLNFSNAYFVF